MKKLLLSIILISGICSIAFSQPKIQSNEGAKRIEVETIEALNLTSAQKGKIKKLRKEHREKNSALVEQYNEAVKAVLTADQKKILEEKIKKNPQMYRGPKDVVEKLKALDEAYNKQKQAIEMTKIAPEIQKKRIQELDAKYATDKREILKAGRDKPGNRPQITQVGGPVNPIAPIKIIDEVTKNRLKSIDMDYRKAKRAIEMSRIAPEAQKQRLADLETEVTNQRSIVLAGDPNILAKYPQADVLKLDEVTRAKLIKHSEDYLQKKQAIEMSRITPKMQQQRIKELSEATSAEREAIVKAAITTNAGVAVTPSMPLVKFDEITQNKLELIGLEYQKEKKAIEVSRIAPEIQQQRLADLEKKTSSLREKVIAADPNVITSDVQIPGCNLTLGKTAIADLNKLNELFNTAKTAIQNSRIAPEMQEKKLKDLYQEYADKRIAIVEKLLK